MQLTTSSNAPRHLAPVATPPATASAHASERVLVASDGFRLAARVFEPIGPARAVILIHSATAVPQSYYLRFGAALADAGLRAITYDYRGVGASRPESLRGFSASMIDWAHLDARAAITFAAASARAGRTDGGRLPLVSIGHSFGGQILGLIDEAHQVDGAIFVGAQLGYLGHWPVLERARLAMQLKIAIPALTATFGELPGWSGLGVDLPAGVARQWARWCTSPDYFGVEVPDTRARFARFTAPTLFYSFTDDDFAPRGAVRAFLGALAGVAPGRLVHRRLHPDTIGARAIGHFGYFRPRFTESLWREAIGFIDHIVDGAPLPAALQPEPCFELAEIEAELRYGQS